MGTSIKIIEGEEIRRVSNIISFDELKDHTVDLFNIVEVDLLSFKYKDDEGDMVTFDTEEEFRYALGIMKSDSVFRVYIQRGGNIENGTGEMPWMNWKADKGWKKERKGDKPWKKEWKGDKPWKQRGHEKMEKRRNLDSRFVEHVTLDDDEEVGMGIEIEKKWKLRNTGQFAWPVDTELMRVSKINELNTPNSVFVGACEPDQEKEVSVTLKTPDEPGRYTSYFKLSIPGQRKFGQRIRAQVLVARNKAL